MASAFGSALRRIAMSLLAIAIGVVVGLPALLWWRQDSLIFQPPPAPLVAPRAAAGRVIAPVGVTMADGVVLHGYLARPADTGSVRMPLVLYFGGNAEEVSWMAEMSARFPGWALLAVNYRGYGGNAGHPGEAPLVADSLALFDWAAARTDVDKARIVAIGRSLGSGVAVQLAAARKLAGVVLVTPFDSLADVAQRIYRFVPVGLLLRHPFDSLSRAGAIATPMLALVAADDTLIPPAHAKRLFEAWHGPKKWQEIARADHNSIDGDELYWQTIAAFLAER